MGSRPLGRPRRRWFDLVEVGSSDVDWIGLAQDRDRWRALVNSVLNLRVPCNAAKLLIVPTAGDHSSSAQLHGVREYLVMCTGLVWLRIVILVGGELL
jgi:hypothetical protein